MSPAATLLHPTHDTNGKTAPAPPAAVNPFTRGSRETVEGAFGDRSTQMVLGSSFQQSDIDVPAFGFAANILMLVQATGGVSAAATTKFEDAPWSVLQNVTVTDVNGRPIVGPLNGYDLYLANKWGGYSADLDLALSPIFSDVVTGAAGSGNFAFLLRIPLQVANRDALGALPNMNSASTYKLSYTIGTPAQVYGATPPSTTLPTVRVRNYLEGWSQPETTDARGVPNAQQPPAPGTTQHWSKTTVNLAPGDQRVRLTRMGNMLRTIIFTVRTAVPARSLVDFPDPFRLEWDGKVVLNMSSLISRHYMRERSQLNPDPGVFVVDFTHDMDYKLGDEMRDQWLPTNQATRLELVGTFGGTIGTLQILTNDVAVVGGDIYNG